MCRCRGTTLAAPLLDGVAEGGIWNKVLVGQLRAGRRARRRSSREPLLNLVPLVRVAVDAGDRIDHDAATDRALECVGRHLPRLCGAIAMNNICPLCCVKRY